MKFAQILEFSTNRIDAFQDNRDGWKANVKQPDQDRTAAGHSHPSAAG
jgi:hypothetical protein